MRPTQSVRIWPIALDTGSIRRRVLTADPPSTRPPAQLAMGAKSKIDMIDRHEQVIGRPGIKCPLNRANILLRANDHYRDIRRARFLAQPSEELGGLALFGYRGKDDQVGTALDTKRQPGIMIGECLGNRARLWAALLGGMPSGIDHNFEELHDGYKLKFYRFASQVVQLPPSPRQGVTHLPC